MLARRKPLHQGLYLATPGERENSRYLLLW